MVWWGAFVFGRREGLNVREVENVTMAWVGIYFASLLVNLPLASRASRLLFTLDDGRQMPQALRGVALCAIVIVVGAMTLVFDERISQAILVAHGAKTVR